LPITSTSRICNNRSTFLPALSGYMRLLEGLSCQYRAFLRPRDGCVVRLQIPHRSPSSTDRQKEERSAAKGAGSFSCVRVEKLFKCEFIVSVSITVVTGANHYGCPSCKYCHSPNSRFLSASYSSFSINPFLKRSA